MIGLYLILKKHDIGEKYKNTILEITIDLIKEFESHEEIFLIALMELLCIDLFLKSALYGSNKIIVDNIQLISMFLTDFNFPKLQKSAFNLMMQMDFEGIKVIKKIQI